MYGLQGHALPKWRVRLPRPAKTRQLGLAGHHLQSLLRLILMTERVLLASGLHLRVHFRTYSVVGLSMLSSVSTASLQRIKRKVVLMRPILQTLTVVYVFRLFRNTDSDRSQCMLLTQSLSSTVKEQPGRERRKQLSSIWPGLLFSVYAVYPPSPKSPDGTSNCIGLNVTCHTDAAKFGSSLLRRAYHCSYKRVNHPAALLLTSDQYVYVHQGCY